MDKRIKYTCKKKLAVVLSITTGRESIRSAARKMGGHQKTVQRWVGLYQHFGAAGLQFRHGSYTGKFKLQVICHMLKNHLSLNQVAVFFGIPNEQAVARWLNCYEREGPTSLLKGKRGRKKSLMAKKEKNSNKKGDAASATDDLAALRIENEYLRAENAFLKKLDALIQEEKVAKKPGRRQ